VDDAKAALLFDTVPDWADPDDPDDRATLLAEEFADDGHLARALRAGLFEVVANQIADDDPPAVWATAERLLAMGIDRRQVLRNLVLVVMGQVQAILGTKKTFDLEAYRAALDRLPLPTFEELASVMVQIARERQPIDIEVLESLTMARLGHPVEGEPYESLLDAATDRIIGDAGPLEVLAGDLVVEPVSLCANVVLTHRLTEEEQGDDVLTLGPDLAGFLRLEDPVRRTDGAELHLDLLEDGNAGWHGPEGWLRAFPAGALLAVRLRDGAIAIEPLDGG
jgi:hypothetical protein